MVRKGGVGKCKHVVEHKQLSCAHLVFTLLTEDEKKCEYEGRTGREGGFVVEPMMMLYRHALDVQ